MASSRALFGDGPFRKRDDRQNVTVTIIHQDSPSPGRGEHRVSPHHAEAIRMVVASSLRRLTAHYPRGMARSYGSETFDYAAPGIVPSGGADASTGMAWGGSGAALARSGCTTSTAASTIAAAGASAGAVSGSVVSGVTTPTVSIAGAIAAGTGAGNAALGSLLKPGRWR